MPISRRSPWWPPPSGLPAIARSVAGRGEAHYYDLVVDGKENANAVWFYPEPKEAASNIRGRVAFWKGVTVG